MPITYDPQKPFLVLLKWRGTILPLVSARRDTAFWFTVHIILHLSRRYCSVIVSDPAAGCGDLSSQRCREDRCDRMWPALPLATIGSHTTLLVFFSVFYNNQCFNRYQSMYNSCMAIGGNCLSFVALLKCYVDPGRQSNLINSIRMLLASVFVHYHGMTGAEIGPEEWDEIEQKGLLFPDELAIIKEYTGKKMVLLQKWCLQITHVLLHEEMIAIHKTQSDMGGYPMGVDPQDRNIKKKKIGKKLTKKQQKALQNSADPYSDGEGVISGAEGITLSEQSSDPLVNSIAEVRETVRLLTLCMSNNNLNTLKAAGATEFESLEQVVIAVKAAASDIVNQLANPLPFPYWHVLNLMMALNYFLLAYGLAVTFYSTFFTYIVFLILIYIFSGLREVGTCLADPFGDDDVDFDVKGMMSDVYNGVMNALAHEYTPNAHRADVRRESKDLLLS